MKSALWCLCKCKVSCNMTVAVTLQHQVLHLQFFRLWNRSNWKVNSIPFELRGAYIFLNRGRNRREKCRKFKQISPFSKANVVLKLTAALFSGDHNSLSLKLSFSYQHFCKTTWANPNHPASHSHPAPHPILLLQVASILTLLRHRGSCPGRVNSFKCCTPLQHSLN